MAKVDFNGEGQELERITAKKNYASSMQSHKMGSCAMFNELHKYMGENFYPDLINEVDGNYAVEQYPVLAFQDVKLEGTSDYEQRYIGLYTVGADKGDKGYFGFKDPRVKDKAIRLEGTDHIKGVGFNYPWRVNGVRNIRYNHDKEALCIVTGEDKTKWTAILEQSYCGTAETEAEIEAYLEEKFMPIYELAYNNNPLLVGTSMSIDTINADVDAFGSLRRTDGRPYSYCEFWIDGEYDVYYLNQERNRYEKNGLNLYDVLSDEDKARVDAASTLYEKNEIFIKHRVNAFKEVAENYICIDDAIFLIVFCLVVVASDNFEKNMYPYIMDFLLRFFNDDLDSIFSTDNQAQDTKKYSAELHDFTDDTMSAYVFKGEDNALFNLIEMAYPERLMKMGKDMLQSMYNLSKKGTKTLDRLNGYYDQTFFDKAQNYYPISAYNNDSEVSYLEAWNDKDYVASVDIHPLAQSLGNHYTTEKRFVNLRNVYLMSKFGFGGFASYEDNSLGVISVRTQKPVGFTLTPAIDMYPTILGGQAQVSKSDRRIKAGESVTLAAVGGGNTNVYIVAADYLIDIGDLKDLSIDPSSDVSLNVSSKRLRWLKLGDEDAAAVTSYLAGVNIQKCDSLETIDARNLVSLKGDVDLANCPRLYAALFKGTSTKKVNIPVGSKIEVLTLPDTITTLVLNKLQNLTEEGLDFGTLGQLAYLRLESNKKLDGWDMMKTAQQNSANLTHIRVIGFDKVGDATDVTLLKTLSEGKYHGIDAEGNNADTSLPIIEGKLYINGSVNGKDRDAFKISFPNLIFNADKFVNFIEFQDPEVLRVLLANGVGADGGVTEEQADAVTSIGTWFKGNTVIETFDEFEKFTGVTFLGTSTNSTSGGAFAGCNSLQSIKMPPTVTHLRPGAFSDCTSLTSVDNLKNVEQIDFYAFNNCAIEGELDLSGLTGRIGYAAFANCKMSKILSMGNATGTNESNMISTGVFYNCTQLQSVNIPKTFTFLGQYTFYNCTSLEIEDLNLPNLETLGQNAFYGVKIKKISNLGKIAALPTASTSTQNFGDKSVLEEIVLPDTLTNIPSNSFYGYTNCVFEDLNLSNLTSLGYDAFIQTRLKKITSLGSVTSLVVGNVWGGTIGTRLGTFAKCTELTSVILPQTLTSICDGCFDMCPNLTKLTLPTSVTTIGQGAFYGVPAKIEINLPNLTNLGMGAFRTSGVTKVVNLGSITRLIGTDNYANFGVFEKCSNLAHVSLPKTITDIGSYALRNCPMLEEIICNAITPPTLGSSAFTGTHANLIVYVPDASVTAYREASGWSQYADRIKPLSEYLNLKIEVLNGVVSQTNQLVCKYKGQEVTPLWSVVSDVATISESGILTFSNYGEAVVTATYNEESVSVTYEFISEVDLTSAMEINKAYKTDYSVGGTFTYTLVDSQYTKGWKTIIVDILDRNGIILTGQGGSSPRLYCYIDDSDKVLEVASATRVAQNEKFPKPSGAVKVIVSFNPAMTNQQLIVY